jgi:ssDNA-specific exonuclease RecJ
MKYETGKLEKRKFRKFYSVLFNNRYFSIVKRLATIVTKIGGKPMNAIDHLIAVIRELTPEKVDKLISLLPQVTASLEEQDPACLQEASE